jgi:hypothetical protein
MTSSSRSTVTVTEAGGATGNASACRLAERPGAEAMALANVLQYEPRRYQVRFESKGTVAQ